MGSCRWHGPLSSKTLNRQTVTQRRRLLTLCCSGLASFWQVLRVRQCISALQQCPHDDLMGRGSRQPSRLVGSCSSSWYQAGLSNSTRSTGGSPFCRAPTVQTRVTQESVEVCRSATVSSAYPFGPLARASKRSGHFYSFILTKNLLAHRRLLKPLLNYRPAGRHSPLATDGIVIEQQSGAFQKKGRKVHAGRKFQEAARLQDALMNIALKSTSFPLLGWHRVLRQNLPRSGTFGSTLGSVRQALQNNTESCWATPGTWGYYVLIAGQCPTVQYNHAG